MAGKIPPRPPGTARRSSSQRNAASMARPRNGRGPRRSQPLRASSTPMKRFFQMKRFGEKGRDARKAEARVLTRHGPQLIEPARLRQSHDGFGVHEDEKGDDDRARPVGDLEEVEEGPAGQEHDLDGHRGYAPPDVLPEEGEEDL